VDIISAFWPLSQYQLFLQPRSKERPTGTHLINPNVIRCKATTAEADQSALCKTDARETPFGFCRPKSHTENACVANPDLTARRVLMGEAWLRHRYSWALAGSEWNLGS
jgi:hypothetical protein